MSTCYRLVPTRPLGRAALNELISDCNDWDALRELLQQLLSAVPPIIEEEATGALKLSLPRKCVPEMGELSSTGGLEGAQDDVLIPGHCYCTDEPNNVTNEFMAWHIGTATEVPAEVEGDPPTWTVVRKVALTPLVSWPPACCKVPEFTMDGIGDPGPVRTLYYQGNDLSDYEKSEWTGGGDVWGNAPTLSANLNSIINLIETLATNIQHLQYVLLTFIEDFSGCTGWGAGTSWIEGPG